MSTSRRCRGITLVELVAFIVMVSTASAGVLLAYNRATSHGADTVVRKQALAIAESLLEEIQQMTFTFCDPDDPNVYTATSTASCATAEALGPEAGETRYSTTAPFDNVNDYNGYNTASEVPTGVKDLSGTQITGLTQYDASVAVANVVLGGMPASECLQISVTVTAPNNVSVALVGYRFRYAPRL